MKLRLVRLATVDSIQGSEIDIVILNTVVTGTLRRVEFMEGPKRGCVMTTRSRRMLVALGSFKNRLPVSNSITAYVRCASENGGLLKQDTMGNLVHGAYK